MKFDPRDLGDSYNWGRNRNKGNTNKGNTGQAKRHEDRRNDRGTNPVPNNNARGGGNRSFQFEKSDLYGSNREDTAENVTDSKLEEPTNVLENFLEEYDSVLSERGNQVPDVIQNMFWDVAEVLTHYYEKRYRPLVGRMNAVLDIMASARFANALRMVLTNEDVEGWCDGVRDVWKSVMFALSTVITCCHGKMKDEALSTYIDLIGSDGIAGKDISRLITENAITKDFALDLIVSIPSIPDDMTDATLEQFYGMLLDKLMKHAEENVGCLDRVTQSKLFTFFFGKEKLALKAIGRMLGNRNIAVFENNSQELVYGEYMAMLFERLNSYDIKEIQFVLRYIVMQKQKFGAETRVVYDRIQIAEYENICKAYLGLIAQDPVAKKVFLNA